jgi:NAD+ kinase
MKEESQQRNFEMLPVNLFLIRHGESEGNRAKRLSEGGDHSVINSLRNTHTSMWPLTQKGFEQGTVTGAFLQSYLILNRIHINRMFVSSYARAMQTAAALNLKDADWKIDPRIAERNWGSLDRLSEEERRERYAEVLAMRDVEPYFWMPPDGECFNALLIRVRDLVDSLDRSNYENVVVVCHGEVIKAFRIVLHGLTPMEYAKMEFSKDQRDRVHNCQIDHYSRRNPHTWDLGKRISWRTVFRPAESDNPLEQPLIAWERFEKKTVSNEDLGVIATELSAPVGKLPQ